MGIQTGFFQVGGTLSEDSRSYVERPADTDLISALSRGEFCLVLAPRQTGKSSLMVHAVTRLRKNGTHSAIVDFQSFVSETDIDQWFASVIYHVDRFLCLKTDSRKWWQENRALSPTQRFTAFLEDVVLRELDGNVVLFFDEIDSVLKQPFSDDFFTTIRSIYNERAVKKELQRLSIVLLGVTSASSLIKDLKRTPFNIGEIIKLDDFDKEKTKPFQKVLGPGSDQLIDRIFHWTSGQPFLVQKLSATAYTWPKESRTPERIDEEVKRSYLKLRIKQDTHFNDIHNYLLDESVNVNKTLHIYRNVLKGKKVEDKDQSQSISRLKLAGVVRSENGKLATRNLIYSMLFNLDWIREHIPLNRQKIVAYSILSVLALTLSLTLGWFWWTTTDAYQIKAITDNAHRLVESSDLTTAEEWGRALALSGMPEKALETHVGEESRILAPYVGSFVKAGQMEAAVRAINLVQDLRYRSWGFAVIACEHTKAGKFDDARSAIAKIEDPARRSWALTMLAGALAREGRVEAATGLVAEVNDWSDRQRAFAVISRELTRASKFEDARAAITQIDDMQYRSWALAKLAAELAEAGRIREAREIANEADTAASKINNDSTRPWALADVAAAQFSIMRQQPQDDKTEQSKRDRIEAINTVDKALDLIAKKGTVADQAWALAMVSWDLESIDRVKDSLNVVSDAQALDDQRESPAIKIWEQVNSVKSITQADELHAEATLSEARKNAILIENQWHRSWALVNVARGQIRLAGYFTRRSIPEKSQKMQEEAEKTAKTALSTAAMISDPRERERALTAVRWWIAQDGIQVGALDDAFIGDAREQSRALVNAAWVLAKAGRTTEANRAVNGASIAASNIIDDSERSKSLSAVASVQAYLQNYKLAREMADSCASSTDKLQAYITILREYKRRQNLSISILLEAEEITPDDPSIPAPVN